MPVAPSIAELVRPFWDVTLYRRSLLRVLTVRRARPRSDTVPARPRSQRRGPRTRETG